MSRAVIVHTDPSPDDAVAFLVARASPRELEVLVITTVAGNVPLSLTSGNARKAVELAARNVQLIRDIQAGAYFDLMFERLCSL